MSSLLPKLSDFQKPTNSHTIALPESIEIALAEIKDKGFIYSPLRHADSLPHTVKSAIDTIAKQYTTTLFLIEKASRQIEKHKVALETLVLPTASAKPIATLFETITHDQKKPFLTPIYTKLISDLNTKVYALTVDNLALSETILTQNIPWLTNFLYLTTTAISLEPTANSDSIYMDDGSQAISIGSGAKLRGRSNSENIRTKLRNWHLATGYFLFSIEAYVISFKSKQDKDISKDKAKILKKEKSDKAKAPPPTEFPQNTADLEKLIAIRFKSLLKAERKTPKKAPSGKAPSPETSKAPQNIQPAQKEQKKKQKKKKKGKDPQAIAPGN